MAKRIMDNPPWHNRLIKKYWKELEKVQGSSSMPKMRRKPTMAARRKGTKPKEYMDMLGCGHYGCVWSTEKEDVVIKITTDPTEAAFIAVYLKIVKEQNYPIEGVVEYYDIVQLPETYRKRPVFVLWRQEAASVGIWDIKHSLRSAAHGNESYYLQNLVAVERWVTGYQMIAGEIRVKLDRIYKKSPQKYYDALQHAVENFDDYLGRSFDFVMGRQKDRISPSMSDFAIDNFREALRNWRGQQAITYGMALLMSIQEEMLNHQSTYEIGQFFGTLHENGMIPADVHLGNIGIIKGNDASPVVTDPGHIINLDRRWEGTTIEQL